VTPLPVEEAIPAVRQALAHGGRAVLVAPPGAGKTTLVPLRLMDEPWLEGGRILMLEPRRLAARMAAQRMAFLAGEPVGGAIGYRVRGDSAVSSRTRVLVVTEGILTRMLQTDPTLEGVGLLVFDEFHERNIHSDLGLALALQSRSLLRPDLCLLVMSATLEIAPVARLLSDAPVIRSEGRQYPVEVRHRPPPRGVSPEDAVPRVILEALEEAPGDILVFLPGTGEIRRVAGALAGLDLPGSPLLLPLFGALSREEQDRAILPDPAGRRRVVLSSAIAETSLTIEGVRVVVDAGLMRVPRFSPRTGMQRLETVRVSRASADQRRGRAGRTAPGTCYRLWSETEEAGLVPHTSPEIRDADLAPLALELAAWGARDPLELDWLDPPPAPAFARARELLEQLGAIDGTGVITFHGRAMAELGAHPRIAHLLLAGKAAGQAALACDLAALLSERDFLRRRADAPADPDIRLRLEILRDAREGRGSRRSDVDAGALRRIVEEAAAWRRKLSTRASGGEPAEVGGLLALAYPDRVAQQRKGSGGRFLLRNGRGARLARDSALVPEEYLVVAEVDAGAPEGRIHLAAPISESEVTSLLASDIVEEEDVAWDPPSGGVVAWRRVRLGAIILREARVSRPDRARAARLLLDLVREEGTGILPWTPDARAVQARILFLRRLEPDWPDVSEPALAADPDRWLAPGLEAMARPVLPALDLATALRGLLDWRRLARLDSEAPTHLQVPSGSRIAIDYDDPDSPVLAVRIQEIFGLPDTPRIATGRVPLTLHLLSPARRPVQVTRDLASFWERGYFEVRKDLRGRYPKHAWPDDPFKARA